MTMATPVQAIFWDNDGVLVDTEHLYFQATQETLASIGIPLTRDDYVALFLVEGRGAWHLAEQRGVSAAEIEALRTARNERYGELLAEAPRLAAGVIDVLESLHGRYLMGVVTSSRRDHFDVIHRHTGLMKYFDFVLTAADFRRVKPDPEPYLRAVERSGVPREACVAIEDSARGLESARAAGISCIVVPTELTRQSDFTGAHRVLGRIGELLTLL
jgi:HAD superfamily hydrolase (TIGR01509 family)